MVKARQRFAMLSTAAMIAILSISTAASQTAKSTKRMAPSQPVKKESTSPTVALDNQPDSHAVTLGWPKQDMQILFAIMPKVHEPSLILRFLGPKSCNNWFSESAIVVLDQSRSLTFPYAAQCPYPSPSNSVPPWLLRDMAKASQIVITVDGTTLALTPEQINALRKLAQYGVPNSAWLSTHEPYLDGGETAVELFLEDMPAHRPENVKGIFEVSIDASPVSLKSTILYFYPVIGRSQSAQRESVVVNWSDVMVALPEHLSCRDGRFDCATWTKERLVRKNESDDWRVSEKSAEVGGPHSGPRAFMLSPDGEPDPDAWDRALAYLWYLRAFNLH